MRWPWQRSLKRRIRDLMDELARHGFADGVDAATWAADVADAVAHGGPWAASVAHRRIGVDAENLAEGGAQEVLDRLAPLLARLGVVMPPITEEFSEHGYALILAEQRFVLWDEATAMDSWRTSLYALVQLIDQVLAQANIAERLYLIGGGNDGQAILLTPEQARLLVASPLMPPSEQPWHPATGEPT